MTLSEQSDSDKKAARDRRALAIAELLRAGHSPAAVSRAVKIADAGGNIYEAMAALREEDSRL